MDEHRETPTPLIQPTARLHKGHTFTVRTLGWSPDGVHLAVGGGGKTIRMWKAASGRSVCTYRGHSRIWALAWSSDSTRLASVGRSDQDVQIWEATTGTLLVRCPIRSEMSSLTWAPDGQRLAARCASWNPAVHIWEAANGQERLIYRGHHQDVEAVAWSPDGDLLASADSAGTIHVWEARTGITVLSYPGHQQAFFPDVVALAWSPDGREIASGDLSGKVHIWQPW